MHWGQPAGRVISQKRTSGPLTVLPRVGPCAAYADNFRVRRDPGVDGQYYSAKSPRRDGGLFVQVNVLSPASRADARRSRLIRSRSEVSSLIRSTTAQCVSAGPFLGRGPNHLKSAFPGSTRISPFLSPLVLPFLPNGHSGNLSLKLACIR